MRLQRLGRRVRLTIGDDGMGFDSARSRRTGFGLSAIEDRAALVGGRATIRTARGRGTTIIVTVPLERA